MQFRARGSRAQSAQVPSGLNHVQTPIGRHLGVIDPNPFAYPIILCLCSFLATYA